MPQMTYAQRMAATKTALKNEHLSWPANDIQQGYISEHEDYRDALTTYANDVLSKAINGPGSLPPGTPPPPPISH